MDEFLANAARLLESAQNAACSGGLASPLSILIARDGGIRTVTATDWPLESLALEHGARMAYRISRHEGRVRVEGRQGSRRCLLESDAHQVRRHCPAVAAAAHGADSLLRISLT